MNTNTKYPTTEYAKKLLYKYIPQNKRDKKGLFLLPLQTGSGKTHATIEYIKENIEKGNKTPIIYTVNTKHNLQDSYNKLIDILSDEDKNKVFMLKRNVESIVDAFINNAQEIQTFKILSTFKEFKSLQDSIELIKKTPDLRQEKSIQLAIDSNDRAFRNEIYRCYKFNEFKDKEQFLYEVSLLYPTVNLHKYKAIFMTTHKLYYPMFGLDGNYTLYTNKHFKNSVLFVDEFDAQKSVLLKMIINNKVKSSYEFLDLFKSIVGTFKTKQFHKKYKIDEDIYLSVKKLCEDIYDKYFIQYGFQYKFEKDMQNETILMDSTLSNIVHGNDHTTKIDTRKNQSTHINIITKEGELSFTGLLRDVSRSLRTFIGMARSAVKAEVRFIMQQQLEASEHDRKTEYEITQRVVNDIIKEFGYTVEDRHYKYLKDVIINGLFDKQKGFKSSRVELYEDGFKVINISQMDRDSKTNNFEFFELNDTPENFMKNLCGHLFVVGISATATIDTLMRNFDLSYLESKVKFVIPSKEELHTMDSLYIEAKNQKDREIETKYIYTSENAVEITKKYFGDKKSLCDKIELMLKNKQDKFKFLRLMRIVDAYRKFLIHDEIESFMCLLPAFLKYNEPIFNPDNLAQWIYIMIEENYELFNPEIQSWIDDLKLLKQELHGNFISKLVNDNRLFYIYNSSVNNKQKYKEMFDVEVQKKSKVFIISAYQTIGIGANLEYERDGEKKDYDAIYLDKPTSFTQRNFENDGNESIKEKQVKAIFELESLFYKGYFSALEYRRYIKDILKSSNKMPYLKLSDSHNSIMSVIIQAIGRLYRTDNDRSKMFVYLDSEISYSVKNFDITSQTLLPAVQKLIDYTHTLKVETDNREIQESKNRFQERNNKTRQKINYMLNVFQGRNINSYTVEQWEKTRKYLLENPTVNTDAIEFEFCYSKMPTQYTNNKYYYTQTEDYKDVEIFFDKSFKAMKVSREVAMLDVIENTQELQECVKQNNICLEFKYDHLMTPIAFNNLYKGVLGEVIGKYLVEKECDIELFAFDVNNGDEYERFDYKLEDDSCYFDFKYYSQQTIETQTQKELREKAKAKLTEMKANRAVIINIFAELPSGKSRKPFVSDNIMIVPFLIDITKREKPLVDRQMMQKIKEFVYGR
ncbi:hypothetical protein [Sulfurimonas sp.]